jgi:hypothetical protein
VLLFISREQSICFSIKIYINTNKSYLLSIYLHEIQIYMNIERSTENIYKIIIICKIIVVYTFRVYYKLIILAILQAVFMYLHWTYVYSRPLHSNNNTICMVWKSEWIFFFIYGFYSRIFVKLVHVQKCVFYRTQSLL